MLMKPLAVHELLFIKIGVERVNTFYATTQEGSLKCVEWNIYYR